MVNSLSLRKGGRWVNKGPIEQDKDLIQSYTMGTKNEEGSISVEKWHLEKASKTSDT